MNIYLILILRLVHIFAGVLWVGAAILYFAYLTPTVKSIGPAGGKFMHDFVERRRFPIYMTIMSLLTILSGVPLYLFASGGLRFNWIMSGPGLGYTIGSVAPLIAFFIGFFMISPRAKRMGALGKEIGANGGNPDPMQAAELQKLDQESSRLERLEFVLLSISMITMATARYWIF
jgi:hypothetical protein